ERGDVVLKLREFFDDGGRQDVRPSGGDLAELDEGWAELLADAHEPLADAPDGVGLGEVRRRGGGPFGGRGGAANPDPVRGVAAAVLGQDLGDDAEAGQAADGLRQTDDGHRRVQYRDTAATAIAGQAAAVDVFCSSELSPARRRRSAGAV